MSQEEAKNIYRLNKLLWLWYLFAEIEKCVHRYYIINTWLNNFFSITVRSCEGQNCHEKTVACFCSFFCFGKQREHSVSLNRALIRCDKAHICGMIDCSITFIIVLESAKIHLTMKGRTKKGSHLFFMVFFTTKIFGFVSWNFFYN